MNDMTVVEIEIEGITPLIVTNWSKRAGAMIYTCGYEPRSPEQIFEDALYRLPDGSYGYPAVAFKAAMVRALPFAFGVA